MNRVKCRAQLIECFFNRLKHFRCVATRYDKNARNFLAAVLMAATGRGLSPRPNRPSPGGGASTSGANTAAGVNNTGTTTQPGAVKDGVNKQ
jgi:hypothetical protein